MDEYGIRNLFHISIDRFRETHSYKSPSKGREPKPYRQDYPAHAAALLAQLAGALGTLSPDLVGQRLRIEGLKPGALVAIATKPPAPESKAQAIKIAPALEFPDQDIVILRAHRNADRTENAILFIPNDARDFLEGRLAEYGRKPGDVRKRPDVDKFEKIETIQPAAARSLFVGDQNLVPAGPVWWELWVREPRARAENVALSARFEGLDVHAGRLFFPDITVIFIHASDTDLFAFADAAAGAIVEIRMSLGTIEPFLDRRDGKIGQHEFVAELASRIISPPADAPTVCVLDTGVSAGHPLVAAGLHGTWSYDDNWGSHDHERHGGHGTALVGLVLYGDLEPAMNDVRQIVLTHAAESMKLLPPPGFPSTKPPHYGLVTQGAVAKVEIERPHVARSFCLAVSSEDFSSARPSSWSGAIDQIAAGSMVGDLIEPPRFTRQPKRLILVATGNAQGGQRKDVITSKPLEDPAQSWNALSIGGFTAKTNTPKGLKPVAQANHRSPYSRGSQSLAADLTPMKPEVLFEAGNMVEDASGHCAWHPSVSLLASGSDIATEPLVPFWATSAAVGVAGRFVGQLQAALPTIWPETIRALTVQSAEWSSPIRNKFIGRGAHWVKGSKGAMQHVLREVGYGVPDIDRAVLSARNDVTLIAEAEIQPYAFDSKRTAAFNEMHFYDLPWPRAALALLENEIVTMKVTLSYFIEPNLSGKAATRPETYRSFGLRFAMKKRSETDAQFRSRINANQAQDGSTTEDETSHWLLGPKSVQAGSLHCYLWRGYAIELAAHDAIAIFPVGGWWKSHLGQRRTTDRGRYTLAISIAAPGHAVDLHAEISNLVPAAKAAVPIG